MFTNKLTMSNNRTVANVSSLLYVIKRFIDLNTKRVWCNLRKKKKV